MNAPLRGLPAPTPPTWWLVLWLDPNARGAARVVDGGIYSEQTPTTAEPRRGLEPEWILKWSGSYDAALEHFERFAEESAPTSALWSVALVVVRRALERRRDELRRPRVLYAVKAEHQEENLT